MNYLAMNSMIHYFETELMNYKEISILVVQEKELSFRGQFNSVEIFGRINESKIEIKTEIEFALKKGRSVFKKRAINRVPIHFLENKEDRIDRIKEFFVILFENTSRISLTMIEESYIVE